MTKKKAVFIGAGATGVFILALVAYFLVNAIAGQLTVEHAGGTIISTESSRSSQPLNQPSNPTGQENQSKAQQYSNEAESPGTTTGIPSTGQPNNPNNQPFTNVFFQSRESNPFIDTDEDRLSTFALDGDTASFEIAREWLKSTGTIDHSSVRPEEWINSAPQGYARSTDGRVSIQLDGSRSLFPERYSPTQNTLYHTLRVGIVMPRQPDQRPPVSAVFVIDGSSSMEQHIVDDPDQNTSMTLFDAGIKAIQEVMDHLQPGDEAAVVLYEETARVVSDWEPHNNLNIVHRKLNQLTTGGSTYAADGITKAYALAESRLEQRDVKIIIISDGVANRGATSSGGIFELVEDYAKRNTVVHTVGVGIFGNYNDVLMEGLANSGNGFYQSINSGRALSEFGLSKAHMLLMPTIRDARVQVDFNPETVRKYRLVGYENRAVADSDFRVDTLDFGEPAASNDVTALYELRIQEDADPDAVLATVHVRYRPHDQQEHTEVSAQITTAQITREPATAPREFRRTAAVAMLAEIARQTQWAGCVALEDVYQTLEDASEGDTFDRIMLSMRQDATALENVPCRR